MNRCNISFFSFFSVAWPEMGRHFVHQENDPLVMPHKSHRIFYQNNQASKDAKSRKKIQQKKAQVENKRIFFVFAF
jgi:hypothetical protein